MRLVVGSEDRGSPRTDLKVRIGLCQQLHESPHGMLEQARGPTANLPREHDAMPVTPITNPNHLHFGAALAIMSAQWLPVGQTTKETSGLIEVHVYVIKVGVQAKEDFELL